MVKKGRYAMKPNQQTNDIHYESTEYYFDQIQY